MKKEEKQQRFEDNNELWCNLCKRFKPAQEFYPIKKYRYYSETNLGYRFYCAECEYNKRKPQNKEYHKKRVSRLKKKYVDMFGGQCQRCGYNEFIGSLHFHHIKPQEKEGIPTRIMYSKNEEIALRELDKCVLVCANCHQAIQNGYCRPKFVKVELGYVIEDSSIHNTTS